VHRDLKPQNILVDIKGQAKLIDFGIAKIYSEQASVHTSANVFIGTVNYSAPEVLRGRVATTKSDIFSLGVVLYHMMTGEAPFAASSQLEVMENVRSKELSFSEHLGMYYPDELKSIVLKMTAKNPDDRYDKVEDLVEDLKKIPYDQIPEDLNVSLYPTIKLNNQEEIQVECRKEGFSDSEIRFIVGLAAEIESHRTKTSEKNSEDTVSIETTGNIEISKDSLSEAIRRFRVARDKLVTQNTTRRHLLVTGKAIDKIIKAGGVAAAIAALVWGGLFAKDFFEGGALPPQFKAGQSLKLRERFLFPKDPNYPPENIIDEVTILEVGNNRFKAKTLQGYKVTQSSNTLLPPYEHEANHANEKPWFERNTIHGDPMAIFPLKVGKKVSNRIVGSSNQEGHPPVYDYVYTCEVMGRESVTIEMGTFNTYKVICSAAGGKNFQKSFFYEPNMRLIVLAEWIRGDMRYFNELIEYTP